MSTTRHFKHFAAGARYLSALLLVLTQSPALADQGDASTLRSGAGASASPSDTEVGHSRAVRPDHFALDLGLSTLVPLSVGPDLHVELPGRVLVRAHLGWMPALYRRTLTGTLEGAGVYDETVGSLVDAALQSSTTWHLGAGLRPFAKLGFEVTLGYAHVALDGSTSTADIMPLVSTEMAERLTTELGNVGIDLDSHIHHLTAAVGWRWLIAERFVIRANLGYMQAVDSSSSLRVESFQELTRLAAPTVESLLHEHYMRYIKLPVVGLSVGYRFF